MYRPRPDVKARAGARVLIEGKVETKSEMKLLK